jgi:rRNA processing protein Gar1
MLRKEKKSRSSGRRVFLGKILHVVDRGLVVKAASSPKLGCPVFLGRKRVGNVIDLFGSVRAPYVLIKPASGLSQQEQHDLPGSDIYMGETHGESSGKA